MYAYNQIANLNSTDHTSAHQKVNGGNENNLTCVASSSPRTSDGSELHHLISINTTTEKHSDDLSVNLDSSSDLIRTSSELLCNSGPSKDMFPNCCLNTSISQSPPSAQILSPISPLAVTLQPPSDCPPIASASSPPQSPPTYSAGISLVIGNLKWSTSLTEMIARLTIGHQVQVCLDVSAYEMCNRQAYSLIWLLVHPPVNQELLSLTTSIRYFSKYNKRTIVIGVSHTEIDVDLQRHGIDEIVVQPVTKYIVQNKYSKLTSVQLNQAEQVTEDSFSSGTISGAENSPNNLVGLVSNVDGIEEIKPQIPELEQCTVMQNQPNTPIFTGQLKPSNLSYGSDHTAKEKLRRERIKESCSQLRVLLPYVRGRKTDMASILELGVNYIKIVNAIIPQELQSQIKDLLSKDYTLKEHLMKCNQQNMTSTREIPIPVEKNINTNKDDQDFSSDKLTQVSEICQEGQVQRLDLNSVCNVHNFSANVVTTSQAKRPSYKMDRTGSTESLESDDTQQLLQHATNKEPRLEMTGTRVSNDITHTENKNDFKEYSTPSRMTTTVLTDVRPLQSSLFNPEIRFIPVVNDNTGKKNGVKQEPPMQLCPYAIPICQMNEFPIHKQTAPVGSHAQLCCPPRQYINRPNLYRYPAGYFGNSVAGQTDGNFMIGRCNFKDNDSCHSKIPMYSHCSNNQILKPSSIKIDRNANVRQSSFYNRSMVGEPLPADFPPNIHMDILPSDETNELFDFRNLANTPPKTPDTSFLEHIHINNNNNDDCGNNNNDDDNNSNTNSYTTNQSQTFNNFVAFQQMPEYSSKLSDDCEDLTQD